MNIQNDSEKRRINKQDIYEKFVEWSALPSFTRGQETGISNQQEFAAKYGVSKDTLSIWKDHRDFRAKVEHIRDKWGFERTPDVVSAIYRSAVKGNASAQKIWVKDIDPPPKEEPKKESLAEITVRDIRFIIRGLPEEMRQKHYDNLRDLLIDATLHADAARLDANDPARTGEGDGWDYIPRGPIDMKTDDKELNIPESDVNSTSNL